MSRRRRPRCWYCGHPLLNSMPIRDRSKTKDHVYPRSRGGTVTVKACQLCNRAKRDQTLEEFRAKSFATSSDGTLFYGEGGEEWEA